MSSDRISGRQQTVPHDFNVPARDCFARETGTVLPWPAASQRALSGESTGTSFEFNILSRDRFACETASARLRSPADGAPSPQEH